MSKLRELADKLNERERVAKERHEQDLKAQRFQQIVETAETTSAFLTKSLTEPTSPLRGMIQGLLDAESTYLGSTLVEALERQAKAFDTRVVDAMNSQSSIFNNQIEVTRGAQSAAASEQVKDALGTQYASFDRRAEQTLKKQGESFDKNIEDFLRKQSEIFDRKIEEALKKQSASFNGMVEQALSTQSIAVNDKIEKALEKQSQCIKDKIDEAVVIQNKGRSQFMALLFALQRLLPSASVPQLLKNQLRSIRAVVTSVNPRAISLAKDLDFDVMCESVENDPNKKDESFKATMDDASTIRPRAISLDDSMTPPKCYVDTPTVPSQNVSSEVSTTLAPIQASCSSLSSKKHPRQNIIDAGHVVKFARTSTEGRRATYTDVPGHFNESGTWTLITVGLGYSLRSRKKPDDRLAKAGLSEAAYQYIVRKDLKGPGHREKNANANAREPTTCWMSWFYPNKEWPLASQDAIGRTKEDIEKRRTWWSVTWSDKSKECPACKFRRANGEPDNRCFFFTDKQTIKVFYPTL